MKEIILIYGLFCFLYGVVLEKNFKIYGDIKNPLFLAKDVVGWIDHSDSNKIIKWVDEEKKLIVTMFLLGQNREAWFLTEYELYEVLMQLRKPIAKQFKKGGEMYENKNFLS